MISFPHAKINLGLKIIEKRNDGFHNIETLLLPIKLNDTLEIIKSEDKPSSISFSGIKIPGNDNICMRAFNLLKKEFPISEINIHLHKKIPIGAGLGGGSSDAAFTLKMINDLFSIGINKDQLLKYAEILGSDCPFFISNMPMIAKGRGEVLSITEVNLADYHLVIITPAIHINTAEAYSYIKPKKPDKSIEEIISQPIKTWQKELTNDFEYPIFNLYPQIKEIKETLYKKSAIYASMSGSGSSVFGIFEKHPQDISESDFDNCFFWTGQL